MRLSGGFRKKTNVARPVVKADPPRTAEHNTLDAAAMAILIEPPLGTNPRADNAATLINGGEYVERQFPMQFDDV